MARFEIGGKQQSTGEPIEIRLTADTLADAVRRGTDMGIAVQYFREVDVSGQATSASPPSPPNAPQPDLNAKRKRAWLLGVFGVQFAAAMVFWFLLLPSGAGADTWAFAVAFPICITLLQYIFLRPVLRPRDKGKAGSAYALWVSAGLAGLFGGLLAMAAVLTTFDLAWAVLDGETYGSNSTIARLFAGVTLLASWGVATPLILAFMRTGPVERQLRNVAGVLFVGSVVESLAIIPVLGLLSRRHSCYSATFSFVSLLLTLLLGITLFGPALLLTIFWRRSRAGDKGRCAACDYDMRGHQPNDLCPECGAGWKPAVP